MLAKRGSVIVGDLCDLPWSEGLSLRRFVEGSAIASWQLDGEKGTGESSDRGHGRKCFGDTGPHKNFGPLRFLESRVPGTKIKVAGAKVPAGPFPHRAGLLILCGRKINGLASVADELQNRLNGFDKLPSFRL